MYAAEKGHAPIAEVLATGGAELEAKERVQNVFLRLKTYFPVLIKRIFYPMLV